MKKLLLLLALSLPLLCMAQDIGRNRSNPIIYADLTFGGADGSSDGFMLGMGLNYQRNSHLFTLRWAVLGDLSMDVIDYPPEPYYTETINDYGVLYGQRFIFGGTSLSVSAGASLYRRQTGVRIQGVTTHDRDAYIGFPFEIDFKLFKRERRPYHIYGLIPVGPPTSFGQSIGIKVMGSVSHTGFIGVGLTFGLGMHKEY